MVKETERQKMSRKEGERETFINSESVIDAGMAVKVMVAPIFQARCGHSIM